MVDHVFWLTPGVAAEPGVWYAGTSPQGLFRSEDGGATWAPVSGFNDHPMLAMWTGGEQDGTPDGPKLHSILVDPRDARHLYIGMSSGGVFESRDQGGSAAANAGALDDSVPTSPRSRDDAPCCGSPARARRPVQQKPLRHLPHGSGRKALGADRERMPKQGGDIGLSRWCCTARFGPGLGIYRWDGGSVGRAPAGGSPSL